MHTTITKQQVIADVNNMIREMGFREPHEAIQPAHDLDKDYGMDSLDKIDLAQRIEQKYNIDFPDSGYDAFITVGNVYDATMERVII